MVHAQPAQLARDRLASLPLEFREALTDPGARSIDLDAGSRLGVDQRELTDWRNLLLAGIAHLDADHGVAHPQRSEWPLPPALLAEIGDDEHQTRLPGQ